MNGEKRSIILGMVFGDGCIVPNSRGYNSATLQVKHSEAQLPYAEHKAKLVSWALGGKTPPVRSIDNSGFPGCVFSKTNAYLRTIRGWVYKDKKKVISPYIRWLTPHGFAIWYMDDGGLSRKMRNGKQHAVEMFLNCHTDYDEVVSISDALFDKFGVRFRPVKNRGKYRLRCGTIEARRVASIVEPFIIGSMRYKLSAATEPRAPDTRKGEKIV